MQYKVCLFTLLLGPFLFANPVVTITTDKDVYDYLENIDFTITIHNASDDTLVYEFSSAQFVRYYIDGIYCSTGPWTQAFTTITLFPDSSITYSKTHRPEEYKLYPGSHYFVGEFKDICFSDTIYITVNPADHFTDPEDFIHTRSFETDKYYCEFTNDGRLNYYVGIQWPKGISSFHEVVFEHGFWLFAYRNDTLIASTPFFRPLYTPGPIIDGQAGILAMSDDRYRFRSFIVDHNSGPGDPDYDEWPVQWGAPVNDDGTPKLMGDITMYTVYNDAYPYMLDGFTREARKNTFFEIHETIWGYNRSGTLGDALFFKWQIYNRGKTKLDSVVICHWNDIDIGSANGNLQAFDVAENFGYAYDNGTQNSDGSVEIPPIAASYFLLQGPVVDQNGSYGYNFGERLVNKTNLKTTAFWAILDDAVSHEYIGGCPCNIQQAYYFATGRRHDGSPLINPITNDHIPYTFTGDPVTGEGWLNTIGGGGMGGYMLSSGSFSMAPGDSQEVVIGLVGAIADTLPDAITALRDKVLEIRNYFNTNLRSGIEEYETVPSRFSLSQNYPNPFNNGTTFKYELPRQTSVTITIFNIKGQRVETLVEENKFAGKYTLKWNAERISSGVYFYQIKADDFQQTRKCLILK